MPNVLRLRAVRPGHTLPQTRPEPPRKSGWTKPGLPVYWSLNQTSVAHYYSPGQPRLAQCWSFQLESDSHSMISRSRVREPGLPIPSRTCQHFPSSLLVLMFLPDAHSSPCTPAFKPRLNLCLLQLIFINLALDQGGSLPFALNLRTMINTLPQVGQRGVSFASFTTESSPAVSADLPPVSPALLPSCSLARSSNRRFAALSNP
jgi:hypothetical protein